MDLKGSFAHDSVRNVVNISRDWTALKQHDPSYVRKDKKRHKEHENPDATRQVRQTYAKEKGSGCQGTEEGPVGFEIVI
jgi:hypothetical protein